MSKELSPEHRWEYLIPLPQFPSKSYGYEYSLRGPDSSRPWGLPFLPVLACSGWLFVVFFGIQALTVDREWLVDKNPATLTRTLHLPLTPSPVHTCTYTQFLWDAGGFISVYCDLWTFCVKKWKNKLISSLRTKLEGGEGDQNWAGVWQMANGSPLYIANGKRIHREWFNNPPLHMPWKLR